MQSKRKRRLLSIWYSCILLLLCSCGNDRAQEDATAKKIAVVSDLLYGEVYLQESEGLTPYIVLDDDYDGKVLLLRKYLLDEDRRMNEYYAYYENCEMDTYLNQEFYAYLPVETQRLIENTSISIVNENFYYGEDNSVIDISRKVFLLSYRELGKANNGHTGKEGEPLAYFNTAIKAATSRSGSNECYAWWLRSVDTTYDSCFYAIGGKGEIGSTNACGVNGVRPAFCISGDTPVAQTQEPLSGENVYMVY